MHEDIIKYLLSVCNSTGQAHDLFTVSSAVYNVDHANFIFIRNTVHNLCVIRVAKEPLKVGVTSRFSGWVPLDMTNEESIIDVIKRAVDEWNDDQCNKPR